MCVGQLGPCLMVTCHRPTVLYKLDAFTVACTNPRALCSAPVPGNSIPKINKPGTPLRPIVSFCTSPTYSLSKHLVKILSPLLGTTSSTVCNSGDFVSFVRSMALSDEVLVSFDVVSLFTKIPIDWRWMLHGNAWSQMKLCVSVLAFRQLVSCLCCPSALLFIPWCVLQADIWHGNGLPNFSCGGKPANGKHRE